MCIIRDLLESKEAKKMMAVLGRAKRVTHPLDDKVKASLYGAGDGEDCQKTAGDSSAGFSDLIQGFLEDDSGNGLENDRQDSNAGDDTVLDQTREMLQELLHPNPNDRFRIMLQSGVSQAVEVFSDLRLNKAVFRQAVMTYLRDCGYNAGICETKWESHGGLTGGNYEFIDVVVEEKGRYLVEVDLAGEFEIARASEEYERVLGFLPEIYVGRSEDLRKIVGVLSQEAKRSLHSRKLHLPPWRKNRYMQAKWFGPYKRSVGPMTAIFSPECEVRCRSVGFQTVSAVSFPRVPDDE
ncbi:uncharacterized protein LOC143891053 [Tasmannia lanceolata]|uniref:uncharacterized protein LOC143891053 n=1 Tax=Tasmannia lanceolata TaxID=3420 RepID=UPI004063B736